MEGLTKGFGYLHFGSGSGPFCTRRVSVSYIDGVINRAYFDGVHYKVHTAPAGTLYCIIDGEMVYLDLESI